MKKILVILIALAALNQTEALEPKRDTQQQLKRLEDMRQYIAANKPTLTKYGQNFFNYRAELLKIRLNPVPDTPLEEVKLRNFAGFLLAWMEIEELGGPLYADDGVRELEALLKEYFIAPEKFPGVLRSEDNFLKPSKELLYKAAGITETSESGAPAGATKYFNYSPSWTIAKNTYEAYFALALLFSGASSLHDENKANELLHKIINTKITIDSALRNKARVALARILEKKHDSKSQNDLFDLLSKVLTDHHNNAGVYPDDAQFAQEAINRLFPQIT